MLANNNKKIIDTLARKTLHTNRKKYGILCFTVILSAFMLFCIFTIGITYLDLNKLQDTRIHGADYDAIIVNGYTEDQRSFLETNEDIKAVGSLSYSGYVKSSDVDDNVNVGLLWCDQTFWDVLSKPARTKTYGHYPKKANELMVSKEALKDCGREALGLGDRFTMTYEDNTGVHTKEFVISGIWEGYGNKNNFYVSDEFYKSTKYDIKADGILHVKFNANYVSFNEVHKLEKNMNLSNRQILMLSSYTQNYFKIILGICGLCFIICLSAYLLIYNILYLSISGKIRYYGLLQSLGMTKKQLIMLIRKQMLFISVAGIIIGIILGMFVSFTMIPYVMEVLGISSANMEIQFHPFIIILSMLTCILSILCGIRKPIRIATGVTPVEATKYHGRMNDGRVYKKVKHGRVHWRMALDQLKKDKKKTGIILVSLAVSLSVFYCLTTIIVSQGVRSVMPNYWDGDLIVRNDTQISEDINSIQQVIHKDDIDEIKHLKGVKDVHSMIAYPIVLPIENNNFADVWMKQYVESKPYLSYPETLAQYQQDPKAFYGMLKGIDEAEFDYLNQSLHTPVNKQDFLDGKVCILQNINYKIPKEYTKNYSLNFEVNEQIHDIVIGAISDEGYYGATTNIGASIIVSKKYFNTLDLHPYTLSLNIKYEDSYDEDVEKAIKDTMKDNENINDIYFESKLDNMKSIQDAQGNLMEIGAVISLLLLIVGLLNYVNTIASNIQNRQLSLAIMESVGMSQKQIKKQLALEGLLYAIGSIFITLTLGTMITYMCYQAMNHMMVPFSVPLIPLLSAMVLVVVLCIIITLISYKKVIGRRSIIDRLRDYD